MDTHAHMQCKGIASPVLQIVCACTILLSDKMRVARSRLPILRAYVRFVWDLMCATAVATTTGNKQLHSDFAFECSKQKGKEVCVRVCGIKNSDYL